MSTINDAKNWLYSYSAYKTEGDVKKHYKIYLKKPTRKLKDAADIFYSKTVSELMKAGVVPRVVLEKILIDSGGIESDIEKQEYLDIRDRLTKLEIEYNEIILKKDENKAEKDSERTLEILREISELRRRSIGLELHKMNAFENSAEAKARNRTILWWLTNITWFAEEDKDPKPLFTGKTDEDKFDQYDATMEDDEQEFWQNILQRNSYLLTFWWMGTATNEESFSEADKLFNKEELAEVAEKDADAPAANSPDIVDTPIVEQPAVVSSEGTLTP